MKVACATTFDLQKPESWPKRHLGLYGASAKIVQTLQTEDIEVAPIGPLDRKRSPITRLKWQFYRNFCHKDFYSWADPIVSRHYARQIERNLLLSGADILLCLENAIPLASVIPDRPMVLWTDTTLGSLIDFYPYLSNLCSETRRNLLRMERSVLERCSLIILNSQWATQTAHDLYDIPFSKMRVIPRVSTQSGTVESADIETLIAQRENNPCRLLFVGVEWQRKGGDTALEVAKALNARGVETELNVVGCVPDVYLPSFVKVHGFIDRTTATGQAKIAELFQSAHFLIYPTRADALGVALSEAGALGVPALASEIGGIGGLVKADITGKTFAVDCDPIDYCEFVMPYVADANKYQLLARSTFDYYKNHASWPAVGKQAKTALNAVLTS
ncbi:MAG: glycosyltransferase family 4 protein [Phormidesmis sp.]